MAEIHERLDAIHAILEKYHQKVLQDTTVVDHSPASVKNIFPKLDNASSVLKEFLNGFLMEETQAECVEKIKSVNADDGLRSVLESLCPLLVPWHPDLSTLVKYMIERRFEENNPFLVQQANPITNAKEVDHSHETLARM